MRTVRNPVVRGVAPDPSVCRVGDDHHRLVTSGLEQWPVPPVRRSTDLADRRLTGHAAHPCAA
ncbi:family 43 glycosylhydrolase [Streptomyces sp. NPDC000348]|uniref:family 43 glycosylhydrolase n=1 Tax=Streptomyces sp. NPDC000348 TaxID=3364538 RepID=UPI0036C51EAE